MNRIFENEIHKYIWKLWFVINVHLYGQYPKDKNHYRDIRQIVHQFKDN